MFIIIAHPLIVTIAAQLQHSTAARWIVTGGREDISDSPDCPEPPPHPPRKEKCAGRENALEVQRSKLRRITHPVIGHYRLPRVADESLDRKNQEEHVIYFSEKRNEVGNNVQWHQNVCNRAGDDELVDVRNPPVGDETVEKSQKIRNLAHRSHNGSLCAGARPVRSFHLCWKGPSSSAGR